MKEKMKENIDKLDRIRLMYYSAVITSIGYKVIKGRLIIVLKDKNLINNLECILGFPLKIIHLKPNKNGKGEDRYDRYIVEYPEITLENLLELDMSIECLLGLLHNITKLTYDGGMQINVYNCPILVEYLEAQGYTAITSIVRNKSVTIFNLIKTDELCIFYDSHNNSDTDLVELWKISRIRTLTEHEVLLFTSIRQVLHHH